MVKLGKHLTKRIAKKPVAKKPKLTCTLDDITFNNCEELECYKKLKEHPYFQEVIDENKYCAIVACAGLTEEKYHNYILLSRSQYGGGRCTDIVAYELFPEKFPKQKNYSWCVLDEDQRKLLKRTLLAFYQWKLNKDLIAIFSTKCLNFTTNRSDICDNCLVFTDNI
ncbi:unnamed protein product [Rhizophagus irregularis]|nr:unnamed protein product [Rhizophagus irregularis]CAB5345102.1 unnamed protein product [Rhizophagus irregularis]